MVQNETTCEIAFIFDVVLVMNITDYNIKTRLFKIQERILEFKKYGHSTTGVLE